MLKDGKTKLIVGNWKMNLTVSESTILAERLSKEILFYDNVETVVAPSFVSLYSVSKSLGNSAIEIAAQDVFWEEKGAFTGEISPLMLRGLARYCLVGHSERRVHFDEKDKDVAKKMRGLLSFGIKPILCIGETLNERNDGLGKVVSISQLEGALAFVSREDLENITIAYEPVWAIGTGRACKPKDALYVIEAVRKFLKALYGEKTAKEVRILYGGSVNEENVKEFLDEGIDGFLVGGASLDHKEFTKIVKSALKAAHK